MNPTPAVVPTTAVKTNYLLVSGAIVVIVRYWLSTRHILLPTAVDAAIATLVTTALHVGDAFLLKRQSRVITFPPLTPVTKA